MAHLGFDFDAATHDSSSSPGRMMFVVAILVVTLLAIRKLRVVPRSKTARRRKRHEEWDRRARLHARQLAHIARPRKTNAPRSGEQVDERVASLRAELVEHPLAPLARFHADQSRLHRALSRVRMRH